MIDNIHADLNIPVTINFHPFIVPDKRFHFHCKISPMQAGTGFVDWLGQHGLYIQHGEFFYTPPGRTLEPHIDGPFLSNMCKLNWMVGGEGSVMEWFDIKPQAGSKQGNTVIGTPYVPFDRSNLILRHQAVITSPSLINVGRVHGVRNSDHERYVYSFVLGSKQTSHLIEWQDAKKIFEQYVV